MRPKQATIVSIVLLGLLLPVSSSALGAERSSPTSNIQSLAKEVAKAKVDYLKAQADLEAFMRLAQQKSAKASALHNTYQKALNKYNAATLNISAPNNLAVAKADATKVGQTIKLVVSGYTMFGTQASALTNTITCAGTLPSCTLTFSAMTAATGSGTATATGPGTSSTVRLSAGSTLAGTYSSNVAGNPPAWCIVVTHNGTYVKYTNAGLVLQQSGGTAPTCSALGV